VMASLISAIDTEGVVAFTGAGTSMPALPSWSALIETLIRTSQDAGWLEAHTAEALRAEQSDFLYVIDEIYKCAGETQTKIKVCDIFKPLKGSTAAHDLIIATKFKKFFTLNYDTGLENAHASAFSSHISSITTRNDYEVQSWINHGDKDVLPPILHWHGIAGDASSIILSGSDYISFYEVDPKNKTNLRSIFSQQRCALIGFGFADPFIIHRVAAKFSGCNLLLLQINTLQL
jgi:hypothetical protein